VIKFLGSLYFAIVLILCTLLFVIAGTFLESASQSHLFAANFTYHNPLFKILLWLYFINILFSALSRYPFQKKHIPFLLTHFGLLLLLLGVFIKNHFGVQGACLLTEGSGSSTIFLQNTYALHIENPNGCTLVPLKANKVGPLAIRKSDLEITLLEWTPHAAEHLEGFIKGNWGHILGLPPFEVKELGSPPALATPEYQIYACQTDQGDLISFPGVPSLFFIQDSKKSEHLIAFNAEGERFSHSLNGEAYYIYNKGYGGYATFVQLPSHFPELELIAPLTRTWTQLAQPKKREEATPRIRLLASTQDRTEIVTLSYDPYGTQFKWPILGGKYLVRFQSDQQEIPLHMRLCKAKQVSYPGVNQPYSYEAQVLFGQEEKVLSMNHVFEKKGYRFYLANLMTSPLRANRAQIVVNYDPAKYFLTYPGAIILALGILLLYLRKRYA
jgi:hypothetical protein